MPSSHDQASHCAANSRRPARSKPLPSEELLMSRTASHPILALLGAVAALAAPSLHAEEARGGGHAVATFAGGCFWCMEPPYDKLDGVISTTSGYAGGSTPNP